MNTDTIFQVIQQGFRIGVGATASLWETLQDPQKRAETLSTLQVQVSQKTHEWEEKGEVTEKAARRLVDQWLNQSNGPSPPSQSPKPSTETQKNVESEIQQLTQQVIALRQELEDWRKKKQN